MGKILKGLNLGKKIKLKKLLKCCRFYIEWIEVYMFNDNIYLFIVIEFWRYIFLYVVIFV